MLEQLKYKNHLNEVIEFGKDGIFVNDSDLRDYAWTVNQKGNRIASLTRKVSTRKLPVVIICDSEVAGTAAKNRLMEVCEKDCLAMEPGQIILGDYYFKCYVTKSVKKNYLVNKRYLAVDLTLTSEQPYWIKEKRTSFISDGSTSAAVLDYNYDFPFDYGADITGSQLNNADFVPSNFRLIIYGACTNPSIIIAGHTYQVNCTVAAGEYLTIDSMAKTIYIAGTSGAVTNEFNNRNKESYIFEKIPSGGNSVAWSGAFGFDIILLEERSEPKWI